MSAKEKDPPDPDQQARLISSWMIDFPWMEHDRSDKTKFFCTICKQSFLAGNKARATRHMESGRHQKKMKNESTSAHKENQHQKFLHKWLQDVRFQSWVQMVPGDKFKFRCTLCKVNISCIGGVSCLLRHAEKADHIKQCKEAGVKTLDDLPAEVIAESTESFENRRKTREAEYVAMGCSTNTPYQTMSTFLEFFKATDPIILQHMTACAKKCSGIVRNVLGPTEEVRLVEILRRVKFSVHIDETTDPNGTVKWMTCLVRYVDPETFDVMTALPRLIDLDSTKLNAEGLFKTFKQYMNENEIPFLNILSVSCDNASVMMGDKNSFKTWILKENPSIIFIPCICHRLALAAKDSCETIPSDIDKFLQSIVHHMNSTKRSEAFKQISSSVQGITLKILNYSKTRWLSRHNCIARIRKLYPSLLIYFEKLCSHEKSNETFKNLKEQLESDRTKAYLAFLQYILFEFNEINLTFQHAETRIHLIHIKCLQFLTTIARNFLKPAFARVSNVQCVDFRSSDNHKPVDQIDFGPDCNDILNKLSENIEENESLIQEIQKNCLAFYVEAVAQIFDRLYYIRDDFFINLSVFDAERALIDCDRDSSFAEVWDFAVKLGDFDKAGLKNEWHFIQRKFSSKPQLDMLSFDEMWKTVLSCKKVDGNYLFPQLRTLIGYIRSLPHSNAAAERAFSLLPDISTKKRNRLSVDSTNSIAVVKSAKNLTSNSARHVEFTEDELSLMSSENLYTPSKNETNAMELYASDEDEQR